MAGKKRKNSTSADSHSSKRIRRPMHCRSCDGAPLIKDCGCRKKPRTQGTGGKGLASTTASESRTSHVANNLDSPSLVQPPMPDVPIDPILLGIDSISATPSSTTAPPPTPNPPVQMSPPVEVQPNADDMPSPTEEAPNGCGSKPESVPLPHGMAPSLSPSPSPQPELQPSYKQGKARATAENAVYGLIEGCYKGNDPHLFHRTAPLRDVIDDAADANTRYRRLIQNLALRAERMSIETGCWLFMAAAHPQGGQCMVTFSSEKLRQEGLIELNNIVNDFNVLISRMRTSRRQSGMVLQRNFEMEKEARLKAEAEVEGMRTAMKDNLSETERLRAEIARFNQLRNLISMDDVGDFVQSDDDEVEADLEAPI